MVTSTPPVTSMPTSTPTLISMSASGADVGSDLHDTVVEALLTYGAVADFLDGEFTDFDTEAQSFRAGRTPTTLS